MLLLLLKLLLLLVQERRLAELRRFALMLLEEYGRFLQIKGTLPLAGDGFVTMRSHLALREG